MDEMQIQYTVDTGIVRGLDYYTKTVFEFVDSNGFTLCGGGRYDGLIHEIDEKQDIPSVGFGMGIERILYFMDKEGVEFPPADPVALYVGILGKEARGRAYRLVDSLRRQGFIVETDYMDRGAKKTVIIGSQELEENKARIKDMETGEQVEVGLDEIAELLKQ